MAFLGSLHGGWRYKILANFNGSILRNPTRKQFVRDSIRSAGAVAMLAPTLLRYDCILKYMRKRHGADLTDP